MLMIVGLVMVVNYGKPDNSSQLGLNRKHAIEEIVGVIEEKDNYI